MADDETVLRAARLYYLQDQTMEAIARELGTSRSSISRMLAQARATGLVEIRLNPPAEAASLLEREIAERFGVAAHVVPITGPISDIDRLERVATTAGRLLTRFFDSNMTMGVAWGSTIGAVSRHLVPRETHNSVVVQLNGAGNMLTTGIDYASEILQRYGAAFGAEAQQFPVPAFFDDPATREAMWRERSTRRVLVIQARMDVALFGLGSPFSEVPSQVYSGGYLDERDYRQLEADGAVGDVATVFYRLDGDHREIRLNARGTGPDFARLRRVARRIAVVSGVQKLDSLRGALAARLITDLVLDEGLARQLMA
ncbi:sugar-binding transcriptional regulator [Pseudolysinimonas sp.]|uniref:sugar-binding transcriptional regulator n=1 Tax=Pseudolysinimonas sp. TaxID=2680009 RepID=UPI003F80ABD3